MANARRYRVYLQCTGLKPGALQIDPVATTAEETGDQSQVASGLFQ
ncbi:hypothetical protein [Streptomyces sp. DSM 118148]